MTPTHSPQPAYITSLGVYLPGAAIGNDALEQRLGTIAGRPSRHRERVLRDNGIVTRHYAIDDAQVSVETNAGMAAKAVRAALARSALDLESVELLSAATSLGDVLLPGFASMVHGELGSGACEVATSHGICAAGVMALKHAWLQVAGGWKRNAVAVASEFASRALKGAHYGGQEDLPRAGAEFDTEFLRWMLSDGAGAVVIRDQPDPTQLSLRIDWIELKSDAGRHDVCMYAGARKGEDARLGPSWLDRPDPSSAAAEGLLNLRQDVRMLPDVVRMGVDHFFELVDRGLFAPTDIDHLLVHYSSHRFKGDIVELLAQAGVVFDEAAWFTNLYTKGNVGSASLFVMLEELWSERDLRPGARILCMVPESGRFISSYVHLTVVGPADSGAVRPREEPGVSAAETVPETAVQAAAESLAELATPSAPPLRAGGSPVRERLVRDLARVWIQFEIDLGRVPLLDRLHRGRFTLDDYRLLLVNLRQQVVEGARWIARAASNLTADWFPLRSLFLTHAEEEHRDYQMLERDYVSVGGDLETIRTTPKNVGSEALSAWMFHRASRENPLDLLGAMFIIEGLGSRMAQRWGRAIARQLQLDTDAVSFLLYHGDNDTNHMERLETALDSDRLDADLAAQIVKTAKVTARLYRLQLEELGNV